MIEVYQLFFESFFVFLAFIFALSSLDEIFIICSFLVLQLFKLFVFNKEHHSLSFAELKKSEQKKIAVMVACWQEASVIYEMLKKATQSIQYENYSIFVGTYPNDEATQAEVNRACKDFKQVQNVILDHLGPTTKSDNINAIWRFIKCFEKQHQLRFEIFAIHDAEDNIPAYGLAVFNHLIPRKSIVQLPVLPLKTKYWDLIEATYLDEFAFNHLVTMRTREWISRSIPTAGVGCGFSRDFLNFAADKSGVGGPLGLDTLTEDYELSLLNTEFNGKVIFFDSLLVTGNEDDEFVDHIPAVRSHFPKSLAKAVVQKSRWILGITLQGAEHLGWIGNLAYRYMLFRDRKALVTNIVNLLGMAYILLFMLDYYFIQKIKINSFDIINNEIFHFFVYLNVVTMIILLLARFVCTTLIYGPIHGLLSIPRIFIGNLINGLASIRAIKLYVSAKKHKTQPHWDKTSHELKDHLN